MCTTMETGTLSLLQIRTSASYLKNLCACKVQVGRSVWITFGGMVPQTFAGHLSVLIIRLSLFASLCLVRVPQVISALLASLIFAFGFLFPWLLNWSQLSKILCTLVTVAGILTIYLFGKPRSLCDTCKASVRLVNRMHYVVPLPACFFLFYLLIPLQLVSLGMPHFSAGRNNSPLIFLTPNFKIASNGTWYYVLS